MGVGGGMGMELGIRRDTGSGNGINYVRSGDMGIGMSGTMGWISNSIMGTGLAMEFAASWMAWAVFLTMDTGSHKRMGM